MCVWAGKLQMSMLILPRNSRTNWTKWYQMRNINSNRFSIWTKQACVWERMPERTQQPQRNGFKEFNDGLPLLLEGNAAGKAFPRLVLWELSSIQKYQQSAPAYSRTTRESLHDGCAVRKTGFWFLFFFYEVTPPTPHPLNPCNILLVLCASFASK